MISYANSVKNRPIFAERAQNDAAGNEIGRTYATKAEVTPVAVVQALPANPDPNTLYVIPEA